jgi:hypothetical protein
MEVVLRTKVGAGPVGERHRVPADVRLLITDYQPVPVGPSSKTGWVAVECGIQLGRRAVPVFMSA